MISRLEERNCDDRGYRVPEKEVLIISVSLGVWVGIMTHPKIPSSIEPISYEQFDGFGDV
jgi:hypothetical protein